MGKSLVSCFFETQYSWKSYILRVNRHPRRAAAMIGSARNRVVKTADFAIFGDATITRICMFCTWLMYPRLAGGFPFKRFIADSTASGATSGWDRKRYFTVSSSAIIRVRVRYNFLFVRQPTTNLLRQMVYHIEAKARSCELHLCLLQSPLLFWWRVSTVLSVTCLRSVARSKSILSFCS